MKELIKLHKIGHELQDVKVLFRTDIKIEICGIKVHGKYGEMLNIPRWIANILEANSYVKIQDDKIVEDLKQSLVKENSQDEFNLSTLDDHFYIKINSYFKRIQKQERDELESLLKSLFRKRHGKIIQFADSSKLTNELTHKLTIEEIEFYNQIHKASTIFTKQIFGDLK